MGFFLSKSKSQDIVVKRANASILQEQIYQEWIKRETTGRCPIDCVYNQAMRDEIQQYIAHYGAYLTRSCEWSNAKIFDLIDRMNLYNKQSNTLLKQDLFITSVSERSLRNYSNTDGWASLVAHAVPTRRAVKVLSKFLKDKNTLSIGSGIACWEHLLINNGCKIKCIDNCMYPFTFARVDYFDWYTYAQTEDGLDFLEEKFGDMDVLFFGWPEPDLHCDCCSKCKIGNNDKHYCEFGYDYSALTTLWPEYVVTIYDMVDFDCGCNRSVLSTLACRHLTNYYNCIHIFRLAGFKEEDDHFCPGLKIWQRKPYEEQQGEEENKATDE